MTKPSTTAKQRRLTAVAYAASALVIALGGMNAAYAQSTAVGSVYGEVASGTGGQIAIENTATGLKRTVDIGANGRFQVGALPPGRYKVQLLKDGKAVSTVEVDVLAGQGAQAAFATGTQSIEVVGRVLRIDTSSATNASIFTAKQLDSLPIASKDMNGIIALAANTVRADDRYDGGVSIGGGGPSENAYFINGFPVTNPLTQLGSMELPFGAIQQFQVQTGGFGAEFGRSVGGVVNVITKSGTNELHGGVSLSIEPKSLRSKPKNYYYPTTGSAETTATDGTIRIYREDNERDKTTYGAYLGGPIIQDKLFFFFAADQSKTTNTQVNYAPQSGLIRSAGWSEDEDKNTRYLGKIDFNINDDHRIEFTALGDNYKTTNDYWGYDYATHSKTNYIYTESAKNVGSISPGVGGDAQILKYTGNITNDLTISALYGQSKFKHELSYSFDPSSPEISRSTTVLPPSFGYTAPLPITANPLPAGTYNIAPGAKEETKSFRFDLEYKLGNHLLRAGVDENRLKSVNAGQTQTGVGDSFWVFGRGLATSVLGDGQTRGNSLALYGGQNTTLNSAGAIQEGGYYFYAYQQLFETVTNAESNQSAQYLEDQWQATKDLKLTFGLRNESFENKNGDGESFLKMDSFLSPRFSATWDVLGDASMKLFGSAGRYSLQIPTHVAVRGASRSTFTRQYYAYTGIDPVTGAPTGVTSLGTAYSNNNEYGQKKDPKSVAAEGMDPTFQDEFTLGIEKALTPSLTGGAKITYRKLKATIDDFCDYRPIDKKAIELGINGASQPGDQWWTSEFYPFSCATINAGEANTIYVDPNGDGNLVKMDLSAAEIGLPKPKRNYFALDLFLEHPFRDGWYGKVTYTYSKSTGNTEGQTKSDNAQQDVAVTSTWDTPELMENIDGLLPNDRKHQIKAYGYYQLTPEWGISGNLLIESGRPKNCVGAYLYRDPADLDHGNLDYGNVYFYCQDPVTGEQYATPRGSQGRLPWNYTLDLGANYKPNWAKGLTLRVDVFNVFNKQAITRQEETQIETSGAYRNFYGGVTRYADPRKVALTASYEF